MSDDRSRPPTAIQASRRKASTRGSATGRSDFLVVGIGASAGGLGACRKLLDELPAKSGMAFILVQHLDPNHESMMVDLLAGHTAMLVCQAVDGMTIEPDHLYIIPPGAYLSVDNGALRLSKPGAPSVRLPFDFLLRSLADACGARSVCVVLSGNGADGSLGLKAVKEKGGLVVVQDPGEAASGDMPRSAILTGSVDLVLPVARIPDALERHDRHHPTLSARTPLPGGTGSRLPEIIDLLRSKTNHDFALYKPGTLERRIERRMAMAAIETGGADAYLQILLNDPLELDLLAKDLFINVTSFFRDKHVFNLLADEIIPDLVHQHAPDRALRVWVAGCSTGEEAYSLAMIIREQIMAAKRNIKLQVFASDVDADAIAIAREGFYPMSIAADVSAPRLARFFSREDQGYRILPELRASIIFTVQDLLADPPFSNVDFISCRNLLIYLGLDAQAKAISLFHFALRPNGLLLLGSSEMAGDVGNRFELASKPGRLYRHIGRYRPGDVGFSAGKGDGSASPPGQSHQALRKTVLADLCRRLVMDRYAPAAVLIDRHYECLYSLGPTERYLRVAPGFPTHDLLAMAAPALRRQLRSAIQQASEHGAPVSASGGRIRRNGTIVAFNIVVQHVPAEGEDLLLICFVDAASEISRRDSHALPRDASHVAELEQELEATRAELQRAVGDLEDLSAEQKAINEEALSVNEEYQSTNEELLTSKEELQSLNEELTALNGQLQETLDRARTTSDDLQNVLYSTDVATIFLDIGLNIRFFTPATRSLFNILPGDIGRPLADLSSLAVDGALLGDAHAVLQNSMPLEREIETRSGAWFARRILPYRTHGDGVEGVVITFTNITEQKQIAAALEAAREQAELANLAKSRFLATASHDLRQPLQTLALLQSLLMRTVEGEKAQKLVAKFDETLGAMSGMLNTLLDINQIEAGTVRAEIVTFPVDELLERMRDEFTYQAEAQKLVLRVVPCRLSIASDPHLLEQMIRNLISNALKYTKHGRVLVGCRRHKDRLDLEVWDTGVGIADAELETIFREYYQVDNPARTRSRGLGLGLSIVERLGNLLGHKVRVRSRPGSGSVFVIEVKLPEARAVALSKSWPSPEGNFATEQVATAAKILVVEDDPEIRDLLEHLLTGDGRHVTTAPDGVAALDLVSRRGVEPDLLLSDYNLPNGLDGVQTAAKLREQLNRSLPTIILTGDISTETLRDIAQQDCVQLNKPVKLKEMTQAIQRLLAGSRPPTSAMSDPKGIAGHPPSPVIFIVDDDRHVREGIRSVLEDDGRTVEDYASCEAFLESFCPGRDACLLVDAYLPGMSGLVLLQHLRDAHHRLPAIMITGRSDVPMAVQAMRAGASDFIEKPVGRSELLASLDRALAQSRDSNTRLAWQTTSTKLIEGLTLRQLQIMEMVLAGHPSKNIAADLGISQRTVENHRASIMKRTGSKSLPALARLALAAAWNVRDELPPGKLPSF